jgi:RNA polymerase sigma factor (sigma-70 family)
MGDRANPDFETLLKDAAWLKCLARRLAREDVAEDAVQDTWVAATRTPSEGGRPGRPWLTAVLRNSVRKQRRSDDRRRRREDALWDPTATQPGADDLYENAELQRRIVERVMALDDVHRRTVLLKYFEGRRAIEIARMTEVPEGTVRWRLKKALERLRADLKELDQRTEDLATQRAAPGKTDLAATSVSAARTGAYGGAC